MFKKLKVYQTCGVEYHSDAPDKVLRDLMEKIGARRKQIDSTLKRLEEERRELTEAGERVGGWLAQKAPTSFFCFTCSASYWHECECECANCYELVVKCVCPNSGDSDG